MSENPQRYKRRWRFYRTSTGARPVEKFLDELPDEDVSAVIAAMKEVQTEGTRVAHYIRNDIYEVISERRINQ